jgi:ATP-dependent protease HslVU (ClpYQ) peptidase subunit
MRVNKFKNSKEREVKILSVVVAIKDNDKIWVGCDNQVTLGNSTKKNLNLSQRKMWRASDEDELVMGLVGSLRDANILSTAEEWIEELPKLKNEVNFKYIVRKIVPKIFKELNSFGRMRQECNIQSIDSGVIFAYKDNAFQIDPDGCVTEIQDILTMGSGYRLCLGAWNGLKDKDIPIKDKLVQVIKSACESDLYVGYPIIIMNTKDKEVEIIDK